MKAYVIADFLAHLEKEFLAEGQKQHAEAIHQALAMIRRAGYDDEDPISEPARGHLFPLMKRAGLGLEDLKDYLRGEYGIHSTKAIPWGLYEDVCQWLIAQGDDRGKFKEPLNHAATPLTPTPGSLAQPSRIQLEWGIVG